MGVRFIQFPMIINESFRLLVCEITNATTRNNFHKIWNHARIKTSKAICGDDMTKALCHRFKL